MKKTIAAVSILALAGTLAFAGPRGEGRQGHQGREDRMKKLATELQLSDAQVDAIREMRQAGREKNRALHNQARELARQYVDLSEKGDTKNADKLRTQIQNLRDEMQIRRLANESKFEEILTPEQRDKLEELKTNRGRRHQSPGSNTEAPPQE